MGSESSKDATGGDRHQAQQTQVQEQRPTIGMPAEVTSHLPQNQTDAQGTPIQTTTHEVSRDDLERALERMAHYLQQRRAQITVTAVGGAVDTLFLRTRPSTHGVDIFGSNLDNPSRYLLDEAMQYALQQATSPLGTDWFNTENQMGLSPSLHRELTAEAMRQNVVIFNQPGLKILAAPWEYAFSRKVSHILTGEAQIKPYGLADAVYYLHQIVQQTGGGPIPVTTVTGWATRFNHATSKNILGRRVNPEYRRIYGDKGIK